MNRQQRRAVAKKPSSTGAIASHNAIPAATPLPLEPIRFVVGTRVRQDEFATRTALGRSLSMYRDPSIQVRVFAENQRGLPEIYNVAIDEARQDPAILVFAHDDVHLLDFFFADRLTHSLARFQILGLAGNKRRVPGQPSWAFIDDKLTWDKPENLSGVVGHGPAFPPTHLNAFGAPGQKVKLLDGLMLIARSQTFIERNVRFDERFDFHFYDLDLCRQAEAKGISMGTMALSVIHESGGNFGSESWRRGYQKYLGKWRA